MTVDCAVSLAGSASHRPAALGLGKPARRAALATLFISSAYTLILWVYQLVSQASYVVALRQFSIVPGVLAAVFVLREPAGPLRLFAAGVIVAGVVCVGLTRNGPKGYG